VFWLVLIFIVVPLVELYVIIQVGGAIGVLPTIALLFVDSVLGAMLLRSQGARTWRRFNEALNERRVPARETFDGALVILGGALLLTPGFVTDIFGLLLLIPPSRAAARGILSGIAKRRTLAGRAAFFSFDQYNARAGRARAGPAPYPPGGAGRAAAGRPYDVEGTGHEVTDEPGRQLPDADAER
jgi:UPF0716 protein FxsA